MSYILSLQNEEQSFILIEVKNESSGKHRKIRFYGSINSCKGEPREMEIERSFKMIGKAFDRGFNPFEFASLTQGQLEHKIVEIAACRLYLVDLFIAGFYSMIDNTRLGVGYMCFNVGLLFLFLYLSVCANVALFTEACQLNIYVGIGIPVVSTLATYIFYDRNGRLDAISKMYKKTITKHQAYFNLFYIALFTFAILGIGIPYWVYMIF